MERVRHLVQDLGIRDAAELSACLGMSQPRIDGLSRLIGERIENVTTVVRRGRAPKARPEIETLLRKGLTYKDIGRALGVSRQRVHQIVSSSPELKALREREESVEAKRVSQT